MRERHLLDHKHRVQHARRDAAGAQRPQHRQPLLEGKPDRRIDDEEADEERQQAEGREVEVKAVGQALEIGRRVRLDQTQPVAGDALQRRARPLGLAEQQPRQLIRHVQDALRDADIDHEHVRHELRLHAQRRQHRAVVRRWLARLRQA